MSKPSRNHREPYYERVPVATLHKSRKGKHFALMANIFKDLETLSPGNAIKVPISSFGGHSLAKIRSALSRSMKTNNIKLRTHADSENLYIWRR